MGRVTQVDSKLPEKLRPFFWDYDFARLSWEQDRDLIIGRVLAHGDWTAVTWLRAQGGDEAIREWLVRRRGAGLSPQRLRFWELILGLPRRQVDGWLQAQQRGVWDQRLHA